MSDSLKIDKREMSFHRRLCLNQVFGELISRFAYLAETFGVRKSDIAQRLGKDAGQINRLFAEPSNLTLETISDLLLALDAEMEFKVVPAQSEKSTEETMAAFREWTKDHTHVTSVSYAPSNDSAGRGREIVQLPGVPSYGLPTVVV